MNDKFNIQSQKVFKKFNDKLNFKLSYQDYQKILLLMKKEDLSNIVNYIHNYINNQDNYIFFIQMILSYYSDIFLNSNIQNYNFCLKNVKENGYVLKYISNKIKDKYYDINFEAVKQNGWALQFVFNQFKDDYNINLQAVKNCGYTLQYVSNQWKDDYNINIQAVKNNGDALKYISTKIKDKYYDINFEAVKQNEVILKYVSKNLLSNKQFIIDCINHNKKCYDYIPEKFKNDTDILKLIENNKNISKENQK